MYVLLRLGRQLGWLLVIPLLMLLITGLTPKVQATDLPQYDLHSVIYQWYGALDAKGPAQSSSHHLLNIGQPRKAGSGEQAQVEVDVQLESQDKRIGENPYPGSYEEHVLRISSDLKQVLASQTTFYSIDDFDSKYRPSRAINLIKSLVYAWTHGLDSYDSETLEQLLLPSSKFIAAEAEVQQAAEYAPYLLSLNYLKNHRSLSKLVIEAANEGLDNYHVTFEYQWWAVNQQGNTELAQIAVEIQVQIIAGEALIRFYKEVYLAPITDAGAEVRC